MRTPNGQESALDRSIRKATERYSVASTRELLKHRQFTVAEWDALVQAVVRTFERGEAFRSQRRVPYG
jgi:hypothetical protein